MYYHQEIPKDEILYDPNFNTRGAVTNYQCDELAKDIEARGLINSISVREIDSKGKKYQVIAGFRRFVACSRVLKWELIPCKVYKELSNRDATLINVTENLSRADLNIVQEAKAIKRLIDEGLNIEEIQKALNQPKYWVDARIRLGRMPSYIQSFAEDGILNAGHIMELSRLGGESEIKKAAKEIRSQVERGIKIKIPKPRKKKDKGTKKKQRSPREIKDLMKHMYESGIPMGLHSRMLAWVIGEISDYDLAADFLELNPNYSIPEGGFPNSTEERNKLLMR